MCRISTPAYSCPVQSNHHCFVYSSLLLILLQQLLLCFESVLLHKQQRNVISMTTGNDYLAPLQVPPDQLFMKRIHLQQYDKYDSKIVIEYRHYRQLMFVIRINKLLYKRRRAHTTCTFTTECTRSLMLIQHSQEPTSSIYLRECFGFISNQGRSERTQHSSTRNIL